VSVLAIKRAKKEALLQSYEELINKAQVAVITSYQGLTVSELTALRRSLAKSGVELHVVRNTLVHRILEGKGIASPDTLWQGPNALGVSSTDPVAAAQAVFEFARNERRVSIRGGILGNRVISEADLSELASLPSRDVLIARVLGGLQSPISGLVTVLSAPIRGLVNVLDGRVKQLEQTAS
jgi:large subunit ribosomal protein L10